MRSPRASMFGWVLVGLSACTGAGGAEPATTRGPAPPPVETPSDLAEAVVARARALAPELVSAAPPWRARLATGESDTTTVALSGGRCFQVLAASSGTLTDLDLRLFSPDGVLLQQDLEAHGFPVLGRAYPICPPAAGAFRVEARARRGAGEVAVALYQTR